jgi:hypothetical protein
LRTNRSTPRTASWADTDMRSNIIAPAALPQPEFAAARMEGP